MLHLQRQRSGATALGEERSRAGVYDENGEGKQVIRYLLEESQAIFGGDDAKLLSSGEEHVASILHCCES